MPGRDGTGPMGHGPMTGGRRDFCGDAAPVPGRCRRSQPQNQFYATGHAGWQPAAQLDAPTAVPTGEETNALTRVAEMSSHKCSSAWIASRNR